MILKYTNTTKRLLITQTNSDSSNLVAVLPGNSVYVEESKKQSQENKQLYSDLTNEIEGSFPSMKVSNISGVDNKKNISINMILLDNLDSTYNECSKLTVKKETRMKEIGIDEISIFVNNSKGENKGILIFKLQGERYEPTLNTF